MLMATEQEKNEMLHEQIRFADKYKREHKVEMMVVDDGEGYHGDILRENTRYRIVYRTDQPETERHAGTVESVVEKNLDNTRRGTVRDIAAAVMEG